MKFIFYTTLLFIGCAAQAQKSFDGLIRAEKNFAQTAQTLNAKQAFLQFMDSNALVFEKGEAVNAHQVWLTRKADSSNLKWHPVYAEISNSSDFGYTTGPWTFQRSKSDDSILARGQYTTIWQANAKGVWKFLLDMGTSHQQADTANFLSPINKQKTKSNGTASLLAAEMRFIKAYSSNKSMAYKSFLSQQSILNHSSHLVAAQTNDKEKVVADAPLAIVFTVMGSGISASDDLGYVYGSATQKDKKESYVRIWRHQKEGWKIAVEVLRY